MNDKKKHPGGLLHALTLDGSGGCRQIPSAELQQWTEGGPPLWLHFTLEEPSTHDWIANESGLNELESTALLSEETRPRTVHRDSRLLITLRGVNPSISDEHSDMISLRIWADGKRIISTRYRGLESTEQMLESLERGEGPKDVQALVQDWVDGIVSAMKVTVDAFEDRVMAIDERVLNAETDGIRQELAQVRKDLVSVRRYLAPQREALNRLTTIPIPWLDETHRLLLRETTDRLVRHIEDLDEVRDKAVLAHEEMLSQLSEVMNRRSYVFTVVATIFLPLGFLTGLMGINVGGMPGVDSDAGFWIVVALCFVVMVILGLLFRFNRWL